MTEKYRFTWPILVHAAASAAAIMLLLFVYSSDPVVLFIFLIAPLACLLSFALLVIVILRQTGRTLAWLLAAVVFLVTSGTMLTTQDAIRPSLRWALWSHRIKAQVLAQAFRAEELKHFEWDGWGWGPTGDWTAYVVYDPTDSLLVAAKDSRQGIYRRYKGIPCEVDRVRRLESHWYSVVLGMNEEWDRCGEVSPSSGAGR